MRMFFWQIPSPLWLSPKLGLANCCVFVRGCTWRRGTWLSYCNAHSPLPLSQGISVSRSKFLNAYVLGTIQMFVWGGGGLQFVMGNLQHRGLFETLIPDDPRCHSTTGDPAEQELLVAAEMTRRTFTNCCNIMQRHDFAGAWQRWRQQRDGRALDCNGPSTKDGAPATAAHAQLRKRQNAQ